VANLPVYDNMHLYFQLPAGDDEAFTRMTMSSAFVYGTPGYDNSQRLRIAYRGLRIDYWPNQRRGRIRGSLHTFALGHNRGIFTAAMVASACEELAQVVGVPGTLLRVVRLEIGVNLATPTSPNAFLTSLSHHKRKPFYPVDLPAIAPSLFSLSLLTWSTGLSFMIKQGMNGVKKSFLKWMATYYVLKLSSPEADRSLNLSNAST
jgi:hypothetical protein